MIRITSLAAVFAIAAVTSAQAPIKAADPLVFDIVSVKPADPAQPGGGIIRPDPGFQAYTCTKVPLALVLTVAYQVTNRQISGGPDWINTDFWNINAKADRPHTPDELHLMLQHLVEDRFQLKLHHETRLESGFNLVVDKTTPKLTPHDPPNDTNTPPIAVAGPDENGMATLDGTNVTLNYLAFFLSRTLRTNVADATSIPGHFDLHVAFRIDRPDPLSPGGPRPLPDFTPIMEALRQQLGLRLEPSKKTPVDYLVIDSVTKPTAN